MKLAVQLPNNQWIIIRDLTEAEIANHDKHVPLIQKAQNRLELFTILQMNYREWRKYLDSLLSPHPSEERQERLELNRLLMNYMASAYATVEHFKKLLPRLFPEKRKSHETFLATMNDCFAVAFFRDFRDYVQHRGLAVGEYKKKISRTSVGFSIFHNAAELLKEDKRQNSWGNSKLSSDRGDLDVVELLREYHVRMIQDYGKFVTGALFPELVSASEFYENLSKEAPRVTPGSKMVFMNDRVERIDENKNIHVSFTVELVPNNLFQELGVSLSADGHL
jgi:hypothetical protein